MMWRNRYANRRRLWPNMSLWSDMRRLQREMDFVFGGTSGPMRREFPLVNLWVSQDGVVVSAEVPGVLPADLSIDVLGETLTITGQRSAEELPDDVRYHRREREVGQFTRTVELPFRVDTDAVDATFRDGILTIRLPRVAEEKPRKIAVTSA
jgi:HSP20 family protein